MFRGDIVSSKAIGMNLMENSLPFVSTKSFLSVLPCFFNTYSRHGNRFFHQSSICEHFRKSISVKIDRYIGETGRVAEPEIPELSLLTFDGWKHFFLSPLRVFRNIYTTRKIRNDGTGMTKFSLRQFRNFVSSSFIRYNQV